MKKAESSPSALKKTAPTPRYQTIVDHISDQIQRGSLTPGDRLLAERELAEEFGVSRISVRKALAVLAGKGLIDVTPRHGAYISEISTEQVQDSFMRLVSKNRQQVRDLYEVRKILEVQVVELAATRRTPQDIRQLKTLLAETTEAIELGVDSHQADIDFHIGLAQFTQNSFFTELMSILIRGLLDAFDILWHLPAGEERDQIVTQIIGHHRQLVAAIIDGDSRAAAKIVSEHIDFSIKTVDFLSQVGGDGVADDGMTDGAVR